MNEGTNRCDAKGPDGTLCTLPALHGAHVWTDDPKLAGTCPLRGRDHFCRLNEGHGKHAFGHPPEHTAQPPAVEESPTSPPPAPPVHVAPSPSTSDAPAVHEGVRHVVASFPVPTGHLEPQPILRVNAPNPPAPQGTGAPLSVPTHPGANDPGAPVAPTS